MSERSTERRLRRIESLLELLVIIGGIEMNEIQDLTTQVQANTDAEDSAIVALNRLVALYEAAANSGDMSKVVALTAQLKAHADPLASAIAATDAVGATGATGVTGPTGP